MKSKTQLTLLVLLIFMTVTPLSAQVITLDSVLSLIDKQNPMLKEMDSKVNALNAYTRGARSWMAPMVGVGTFMTPYPGQEIMEERDKGSVMISVEQQIPNPQKLSANKKYLESRASIVEQGRSFRFNALRTEAKGLYYQWLVAERKLNVLGENRKIVELMIKLARLRYPYNQAGLGNIYKIEGRLGEIQNMLLMTQGNIEDLQYKLKALMNLSQDVNINVDTATQVNYETNQLDYDTALLSARSDVRQLNKTIESMRLNQQLQRSQAKPDFRLRFDHMQPIGAGMPVQFTAMAMISIPIAPWSSRMYKSEIKGMQFDIEAMQFERESILLEARGMLAGMANKLNRMQQQLDNYESKIIPALQKNYQTLMLAYEENREQLPNVIDGWEALNMVQMEYLNKMEEYYLMIVSYEKEIEK